MSLLSKINKDDIILYVTATSPVEQITAVDQGRQTDSKNWLWGGAHSQTWSKTLTLFEDFSLRP